MKLGLFGALGAPQYGGYVSDIHDSGQLLLSLINDLLDLSKIEAGRYTLTLERCGMEGLVDSATRLVRDRATVGRLKLKSRIAAGTPDLWVDRRAALQIFSNLLTNAVKFTPKGGKVTINVAPLPVLAGQPAYIAITVTDTGIGIDKADLPKVLSAFGQVDARRAHPVVRPRRHGRLRPLRNGDRQHEPAVVVGVLADDVHAPGRVGGDHRRRTEQRREAGDHATSRWTMA